MVADVNHSISGELRAVALEDRFAPLELVVEAGELGPTERCEQIRQAIVETDVDVLEVGNGLAGLRRQVAGTVDLLGGPEQGAAAARRDDLVAVERERPEVGERARSGAAADRPEPFRRVLDEGDPVVGAQRPEPGVVGAHAVEVDSDDRRRWTTGAGSVVEQLGEQFGVEAPRRTVDVAQHGCGTDVYRGERRGRERRRLHDDLVAGLHASDEQGELERRATTRQRGAGLGADVGAQLRFELVDLRAERCDPAAVEGAEKRVSLGVADVGG